MHRRAVCIAVSGLLAAACSGGSDAADTTPPTSAVETTVPPETSESVATTDPPPTTDAPATTAPNTSPPTTAAPPTTAFDDPARLEAAGQTYLDAWAAYHEAIQDPANPALRAEIERLWAPEGAAVVFGVLDGFVDRGVVARPNPTVPAQVTLVSDVKPVPGEQNVVDVVVCEVNSELYFEIGTAPDGGDALVSDEVVASKALISLKWTGSDWLLNGNRVLSQQFDETECAA